MKTYRFAAPLAWAVTVAIAIAIGAYYIANSPEANENHFATSNEYPAVNVGDQAINPQWMWVDVFNSTPIIQHFRNANRVMERGDTCGLDVGDRVTVLEVMESDVLVTTEANEEQVGTACPAGTEFKMSQFDFRSLTSRFIELQNEIKHTQRSVESLLAAEKYGSFRNVGNEGWVDVVNLEPLVQEYSNGTSKLEYGDSCLIKEGSGTIRSRGEINGRTLYEFRAHGTPIGTPCPTGVLFFKPGI